VGLRTLPLPPGRCLSRFEVSLCETKGIGRDRMHNFRRQRGEYVKDSSVTDGQPEEREYSISRPLIRAGLTRVDFELPTGRRLRRWTQAFTGDGRSRVEWRVIKD
jgi:hypothetical protein